MIGVWFAAEYICLLFLSPYMNELLEKMLDRLWNYVFSFMRIVYRGTNIGVRQAEKIANYYMNHYETLLGFTCSVFLFYEIKTQIYHTVIVLMLLAEQHLLCI